jgi:hypothetical protein
MSERHLDSETAWALLKGELESSLSATWKTHAAECSICQKEMASAQQAIDVLKALPTANAVLPDALSRRVRAKLEAQLSEEDSIPKNLFSWWNKLWLPVGLAAAAGILFVGYNFISKPKADVVEVAKSNAVNSENNTVPVAPLAPVETKKFVAKVRTQNKSNLLSKNGKGFQKTLAQGDAISTEKGGNVWFEMPDGTKAQVSGTSTVTVAQLSEKHFGFDLKVGTLALEVPHREDRLLTVQVGNVLVKDLGTRFVVSRDARAILVAVEEGSVEVQTPQGNRTLVAGHAVRVKDNSVEELDWEPVPLAKPKPIQVQKPSPAKLGEEDADVPVLAVPEVAAVDSNPPVAPLAEPEETWNMPDQESDGESELTAPPPPVNAVTSTTPAPVPPVKRKKWFVLEALEDRLNEIGTGIDKAVFHPPSKREAYANKVTVLADRGEYSKAIIAADKWLKGASATDPIELTRSVLLQKIRCLNRLGRFEEAQRIVLP